ncbi:ATP-binding protein [Actinoplanes sp. NPDC051861]|uniref:ATP-binding protein n=1 Tax=Actinoplanes sp. NPDC051861 TaxID=3155170 RepID=UPI00342468D9
MSLNAISLAENPPAVADWRLAFRRLDALLAGAVAGARQRYGADAGHDSFRGLYITEADALAALHDAVAEPLRGVRDVDPGWAEIVAYHRGWAWVRDTAGLSDAELDAVLVALGPEADVRYERLYGYLQDDVSRRRPTAGLILELISESAGDRIHRRALFGPDRPLLRHRLLRLVAEDRVPAPPLLSHVAVLDEQIAELLLAPGGFDRQVAASGALHRPAPGGWAATTLPPDVRATVLDAALKARDGDPLRVHFHGPAGSGRGAAAGALAGELGVPLLRLDTARLPDTDEEAAETVFRAFREAALHGAVMYVDGLAALPPGSRRRAVLGERLAEHTGITLLSDTEPWAGADGAFPVLEVSFGHSDPAARRAAWARNLRRARAESAEDLAATLADRFTFGPARIAEAVTRASVTAGGGRAPTAAQVFAAARRQTGHRLAALARRIEPVTTWDDIVLPDETTAQLTDLCARVRLRSTVLSEWGFGRKLPRGRGTSALFTGPPGTGKTSAAEVIAGELGLDLYSVDLASVVSKYIGETEKNLERIFGAAAEADAILMFDEADALFGKRSEVHDAHDRYANIETSYLLQRMEQYDGIAILATNLRQNLDEALTRRLQFVVDFPFPDDAHRAGIWRICFPAGAPLAGDLDFGVLARDFRLTGAEIKNAALHAAYLAADRGEPIGAEVLHRAIRREFRKMGRVPPEPVPDGGR